MITPLDAFRLYVGVNMHFTKADYDVKAAKGKGYRATQEALDKRNDRRFFASAARKFTNPKDWIRACVAGHVAGKPYVGDILENDCAIYRQFLARYEKMGYQFQQDLQGLLETSPTCQSEFADRIAKRNLGGRLTPESAVILNRLYGWIASRQTTDSISWPRQRFLLTKYDSFVPRQDDRYHALANKVFAEYPEVAEALTLGR